MSDHATLSKVQGSITPQSMSAFHALFLSVTRPLHTESNRTNTAPYLILFQHTQHFSQRLIAAEPDSSSHVYRNAGLQTPKESSIKDSRGDLFVKEAWGECVNSCAGKVILVKCSDSLDFGFNSSGGNQGIEKRDVNVCKMFEQNGVLVDLSSDPLDWDGPDDDHPSSKVSEHQYSVHTVKGKMCNVNSILSALQDATTYIATKGSKCTHPIPIIFDSITPLVLYHGVEKIHILLTVLKQTHRTTFVSPIFIPILSEILPPSSNRILEDYADAVMTLYGGKLSIAKRSARNGGMVSSGLSGGLRLVKEVQHFQVKKDYAGDELILIKGDKQNNSEGRQVDENKVDASVQDVIEKTEKIKVTPTSSTFRDESKREKSKIRPMLKHEHENDRLHSAQQLQQEESKPKPVIYLEENDPEFQDLDEEDPDDDLDI